MFKKKLGSNVVTEEACINCVSKRSFDQMWSAFLSIWVCSFLHNLQLWKKSSIKKISLKDFFHFILVYEWLDFDKIFFHKIYIKMASLVMYTFMYLKFSISRKYFITKITFERLLFKMYALVFNQASI